MYMRMSYGSLNKNEHNFFVRGELIDMEYNNAVPVDTDLGPLSVQSSRDSRAPGIYKKHFVQSNGIFSIQKYNIIFSHYPVDHLLGASFPFNFTEKQKSVLS